jgi:hypothetical protein
MEESCFCGQTDELEDREPILDDDDRWALRCRATGAGRILCAPPHQRAREQGRVRAA